MSRTFIFQKDGGGEEERKTIDIGKTVNDLLNLYLNGKSVTLADKVYAFMVGPNPLLSNKYINSQIKNVRILRDNTVIKVREVDTKAGGIF